MRLDYKVHRTVRFADNIVISCESSKQVEENLERWGYALERRELKVSHSKNEQMCLNERDSSVTINIKGVEIKKVEDFKY